MDKLIERDQWMTFFTEFSKDNQQRPTRLEILSEAGDLSEEHDLPLLGIDLDDRSADAPSVEILLGGEVSDSRRLSHTIPQVHEVWVKSDAKGRPEVVAIESEANTKTLLYLEETPEMQS